VENKVWCGHEHHSDDTRLMMPRDISLEASCLSIGTTVTSMYCPHVFGHGTCIEVAPPNRRQCSSTSEFSEPHGGVTSHPPNGMPGLGTLA